MRLAATALPLLLLASTALAPSASAAASGCALPNPGAAVPTPFLIGPPFPHALGAACTVVPVVSSPGPILPVQAGKTFTSTSAACPALPYVGPGPGPGGSGELCGPRVPGLSGIDCTATITGGPANIDLANLRRFVIGLDYVVASPLALPPPVGADGNVVEVLVTDFEPLRYDESPVPVLTMSVHIDNPLPVDARVIAYPMANQPVMVGCA
jgi:hypothetical protein